MNGYQFTSLTMRRLFLALAVLLIAAAVWWSLRSWLPGGSERFYLLLPPVFIVLAGLVMPNGWSELKRMLRPAACYFAVLVVFCALYALYLSHLYAPLAQASWWQRINPVEVLAAAWFLAGIKLLMSVPYAGVKRGVRWLDDRLLGERRGVCPPVPPRNGHGLMPQVLPGLLLLLPILIYVLASLYIHRLKVPNLTNPRTEWGRHYEDVSCVTDDGHTLRGWFLPAEKKDCSRTLLVCHGLAVNRSNFLPYLKAGDALDANVLIFDFRGHGDSDGHTVTFGHREKDDVLAAVRYLREQRPEEAKQVFGMGISMGASALLGAAAELEPPFDGLVIDSGFTAATALTDKVLATFPDFLRPCLATPGVPLASLEAGCWLPDVRPIEAIEHVRAPIVIIHARTDPLIGPEHAHELFERARAPKHLWIAPTDGHGSALRAYHQYMETVARLERMSTSY